MKATLQLLRNRGFIEQITEEEQLGKLLDERQITCYVGFDPTADSLHVGHLQQIMVMAHLQRLGHRPIALVGGGTAMVGDPSGKTETRQMLSPDAIFHNKRQLRQQLSRFLDFGDDGALMVDNAEWLQGLGYIEFLRDIGKHFSVNRMLAAEAYKSRLETGLSFLEFNYQLLQAYDFLILFQKFNCTLQLGGNDQWGNILAGVELVRRIEQKEVYGLTTPLLTTASGQKMGKTAAGALWLDGDKVTPYDFYQYWINVDDRDVVRLLKLYTFLPLDEIQRYEQLSGADLRDAKRRLALEVTSLVHGKAEAERAEQASRALFGSSSDDADIPTVEVRPEVFAEGIGILDLFQLSGLVQSKGEARRLIQQGGGYLNKRRIDSIDFWITSDQLDDDNLILRAGKKRYRRILVK